jgi:hypothetical protein
VTKRATLMGGALNLKTAAIAFKGKITVDVPPRNHVRQTVDGSQNWFYKSFKRPLCRAHEIYTPGRYNEIDGSKELGTGDFAAR